MSLINELKQKQLKLYSRTSIRKLLQQRWLVVALALILTGFGAAITGVLFKAGVYSLNNWRLALLKELPAWFVLPALGGLGGFISGSLIVGLAPSASGSWK